MKIHVHKLGADTFSLAFGGTEVALSGGDLKALLLEIMKVIKPGAQPAVDPGETASELARAVKGASDVGVQSFLRTAQEDDLLVLLKVCETDQALLDKVYGNMTERWRTLYQEDLSYKFTDEPLGEDAATAALGRLVEVSGTLSE